VDAVYLPIKVRDVAASADPVTRTLLVKAALPMGTDAVLGATVTVMQKGAAGDSSQPRIKLPTSALRLEGAKTTVWLLDPASMTVKSQPITVSTADGNEVLVDSGLRLGEQVVTTGVHALTSGQKVTLFGAVK
jgi:multidrug efflux pump subunit AcrA (membrane-fusion protein)